MELNITNECGDTLAQCGEPTAVCGLLPTKKPFPKPGGQISKAKTLNPESEAPTNSPSVIGANAGTLTAPPFPLNHPRFLVDNALQQYNTLSATNAASGFPVINALTPNTFETWRFSTAESTLSVDFGGSVTRPIDMVCIGGHNLGSATAQVEVWYEPEPGGTFLQFGDTKTPAVGVNSPLCFFEQAAVNALTVEVRITSVSGTAQISYISGGVALQMQRPLFNGHVPITDGDMTTYYNNKSESGNIIGRAIRAQGYKTDYSFQNIDDTWYRQYFAPFKQKVKLEPIFTAWNLLEYPDDIGYGMVEGDIQTSMQNGTVTKRSGLSFTLLGY